MINYNAQKFSQIMLRNSLKDELYLLKSIVAKKINATWNLSFGDVLKHLIDFYKANSKSDQESTIIVAGHTTVFSRGSIILPKKRVIGSW